MSGVFEVAAGSVAGRDHTALGRNNQDAYLVEEIPEAVLAVVTDGCGSGRFSEVGARLGARLTIQALRRRLPELETAGPEAALEAVRRDVVEDLGRLMSALGGVDEVLASHFLFTIVGAAITRELTVVFMLGDGVVGLNGRLEVVTCPANAPPYLAYALAPPPGEEPRFRIAHALPTSEVTSVLVGTDGVADLLAASDRPIPGQAAAAGPLSQYWEEGRYFGNPALLARRLALLNRSAQRVDWSNRRVFRTQGLLPDDTTLVVIRRRPTVGEAP